MSDPTDLVAWLTAVLDKREQTAADIESVGLGNLLPAAIIDGTGATVYFTPEADARIVAALSPDAMRRAVAVKRKILDDIVPAATSLDADMDTETGQTYRRDLGANPYLGDRLLRLLAEEFAGEPGYREEWRP